jgi:hypothetical protein
MTIGTLTGDIGLRTNPRNKRHHPQVVGSPMLAGRLTCGKAHFIIYANYRTLQMHDFANTALRN